MAVIAKHCPEIKVLVVDRDATRIQAWNSDVLPIYEPGLRELVEEQRGVNLFFETDVIGAIKNASIIFIAVNTPTRNFGVSVSPSLSPGVRKIAGRGFDLSAYESVARTIAAHAEGHKVVVEKSTVPIRTAEKIRKIFDANKREGVTFEVVSNPEFLAEGTAIRDLTKPDRILIGGMEGVVGADAVKHVSDLYAHWVATSQIITTNLWSAELAKLACNAFLAQRVSSINSFSAVCERSGADIKEISRVLSTDSRIGSKFLTASVGFGGSCFGKDLLGLIYLCDSFNLPEVAAYWQQVLTMNNYQKSRFSALIVEALFDNIKGKKISVLGFTFKKNTNDVRESPAEDVCRALLGEGAVLNLYDPQAEDDEVHALLPKLNCFADAYAATEGSHAIAVLTEWDEFVELDYERLFKSMAKPAFLFDGRNYLDHKKIKEIGFQVFAVGKGFL